MPSPAETGPVLITGCSSGLGQVSARLFQAAGYRTVATSRRGTDLEELRTLGCDTLQLDVADEGSRCAAVETVEQRYGAVGVLVNNAGRGQYGPIEEIPLDQYRLCFETNVFGPVRISQLVLPAMRKAGRGRIVNVSSLAGRVGSPGGGAYHMTKFAVEAMTDALRPEVKPFGIDVVNVLPGPFASCFGGKIGETIPDTGPDSPYANYKRNLEKWMTEFMRPDRLGTLSCERVARVVFKAATVRRPRTRYNVGFIAKFGPIGRALTPDRVVDAHMTRQIPFR